MPSAKRAKVYHSIPCADTGLRIGCTCLDFIMCCSLIAALTCGCLEQDVLARAIGFLKPNDAEAFMLVSQRFHSAAMSDVHWRIWASRCWADRQMQTFQPKLDAAKATDYRCGWRNLYWDSIEDSKREILTEDEITRTLLRNKITHI